MNLKKIISTVAGVSLVLSFAFALTVSAAFSRDLAVGSKGADVKELQVWLNANGFTVSTSGAGSKGYETMTFGPATKAAVMKYQTAKGISAIGRVGPLTRASLNSTVATTPSTPSVTTPTTPVVSVGTGLSVSSPVQPMNSIAPYKASRVPFTKVTLTAGADGDVAINSLTVARTGLAQDAAFSGIVLLDENGLQIGIAKTLNSNHQVTVGEPFVVKSGTSRTVTVAGNMELTQGGYAGQVATLTVVGVNTSATVSGSLPITGAAHTVNETLTLGTVTLDVSSLDPNGTQSKEIGTTAFRFAGIRATAGSAEQVRLWSVRWNQTGSVGISDLANAKTYVDGVAYPTVASTDGKYITSIFPSGILIDKGFAKDIHLSADIVGTSAASRTIQFDLYKNTDLYVTGETYGYGVIAIANSSTGSASTGTEFTSGTPFFSGSLINVNAGSATSIAKSNSVPAQNIAVNVANQVLGGYDTDIKGEPISVQSASFTVSTSSTSGPLTNVSIVNQNGAVVAGPVDQSGSTLTFSDTITYPVGKNTYTLKGKVASYAANGAAITLSTTPSGWSNITGQVTGNSITFSTSNFSMNQMTVKSASLAASISATPTAQTIVAGTTARLFANYQFDATQSGEDMQFSSVGLTLGGSGTANLLNTCQLFDGSTALNTGSNVVTGASTATFTFDQPLTVVKGTVKSIALKCNIGATASGTYVWGITTSSSNPSAQGVVSRNSVTASGGTLTGQTLTIGSSATLAVTKNPSSPVYSLVAANTTGNVVGIINLRGTNEDVTLQKLGLSLTGAVGDLMSASGYTGTNSHVTVWNGSTQVGSATFTTGATVATSTFANALVLPKDTDVALTIKADLANIGSNMTGTPGRLVSIDYDSSEGVGSDSGAKVYGTGSTSFAGLRLQKSYPTITYSTVSGVAQNGTNDLVSVSVTGASSGPVQLNKLTFSLATTTATVSSFTFTGPNGSVASTTSGTGIVVNPAGTTVTVYFDSTSNTSDKTVGASETKTYILRASDVSLTGTNSTGSVTLALKADTAYPSWSTGIRMGSTTASVLASQNVVWSPISTTSSASLTAAFDDWTNGYGLPGCFATAGLGTNCQGRTISK